MPFIGNRLESEVGATPTLPDTDGSSIVQELSDNPLSKTARRFSRSTVAPFRGTSRSQKYRKESVVGECPQGQNYYVCQANGFRGCCSKNACDAGVVCPVSNESTKATLNSASTEAPSKSATTQTASSSSASDGTTATTANAKSETREVKSSVTSAAGTPTEATVSATAIRATEDVTSAPTCPKGNGTTYTDNTNIAYIVRCASDNSAMSFKSVQVAIGGYAQCFSSCSSSSDCVGFTYVGLDGGTCYLKATMPSDTYVAKADNNYISCAKINPNASAPRPSASATPAPSAKQPNKGAIAGGVVGGIAVIGLVLFLIAFLARRRRKDLESKRATLTHVFGGAIEPGRRGDDDTHTLPLHHRNGSTSSDPFVQFGGYQRGNGSIARDYATHNHSATTTPVSNKGGSLSAAPKTPYPDTMPYTPAGTTKSSSPAPFFLPSTTYQPPTRSGPEAGSISMLDSTPIAPHSTSRSPRFHEHISELADTSSPPPIQSPPNATRRWGSVLYADRDSATLGLPQTEAIQPSHAQESRLDEARRRQQQLYLMSWNNYDDSRAAELQGGGIGATVGREDSLKDGSTRVDRKQGEVSPDDSHSPLDRKFIVSPMGTIGRGRN